MLTQSVFCCRLRINSPSCLSQALEYLACREKTLSKFDGPAVTIQPHAGKEPRILCRARLRVAPTKTPDPFSSYKDTCFNRRASEEQIYCGIVLLQTHLDHADEQT